MKASNSFAVIFSVPTVITTWLGSAGAVAGGASALGALGSAAFAGAGAAGFGWDCVAGFAAAGLLWGVAGRVCADAATARDSTTKNVNDCTLSLSQTPRIHLDFRSLFFVDAGGPFRCR